MKLILLATFIVGSAVAQVIVPGKCPTVNVVSNFNAKRYLGKWYEAERYFAIFQGVGKCVTATYSLGKNGTITVLNKQISSITGKESTIQGYATPDNSEKAKLTVVFPSQVAVPSMNKTNYWVVDTDYTSYSIVWSCSDFANLVSARFAWILTREQNPAATVLEKAYQALEKNRISRKPFFKTNQKDCPAGN